MSGSHSDHSLERVPDADLTSGMHIWLIIVGGVIGVPVFIMAARIGGSLGLAGAVPVFLIGCIVAAVLGTVTSLAGAKTRLSTYMLTIFSFGRHGALFVNAIIALSLVGWFAVIGSVFGDAALNALEGLGLAAPPVWSLKLAGCLLMVMVSIFGFRGIDRLALFLVPLMLLFLGYAACLTWGDIGRETPGDFSFSKAVSAVVGSYIVGVVIQPDYSRFAKNMRHAGWSVGLALGVAFPVVLLLSAIPAMATGEQDIILVMIALGIGLPAFLLLLLGAWSSNVLCLYSAGLAVSTLMPRFGLKIIIAIIGTAGTALALMNVQDYFLDFLVVLGVGIPPIAAIYALEVFLLRRVDWQILSVDHEPAYNLRAFIAWGGGALTGYLSDGFGLGISGIGAIDAIIVSACLYMMVGRRGVSEQSLPRNQASCQ
ncbi:purine-cytosine permease family protein [Kordiimonas sp.]|uniref:purine-cytosine permease family protein n=1 Tax=Kordiimonas sp. TaxID=1970157 RepID=UPI003A933E29